MTVKKSFTSFRWINSIVFLISILFYAQPVLAQTEITIPMDTLHWEKVSCGNWKTSGDSLIVYGTDYHCRHS